MTFCLSIAYPSYSGRSVTVVLGIFALESSSSRKFTPPKGDVDCFNLALYDTPWMPTPTAGFSPKSKTVFFRYHLQQWDLKKIVLVRALLGYGGYIVCQLWLSKDFF